MKSNAEMKNYFRSLNVPIGDGPTAKGRCYSSLVIPSFPLCFAADCHCGSMAIT